jgi:peroxiredoxin
MRVAAGTVPGVRDDGKLRRALWLAVLAAAVLAVILAALVRVTTPAPLDATRLAGRPAPLFSLRAERDGQLLPNPISLSAQRGHPVLLVFGYSLCAHCLNGFQAAREVAVSAASRGLVILSVDSPAEDAAIIDAYAQRLGLGAPILLDPGSAVAARYGIAAYPAFILVDRAGVVRGVWSGEVSASTLETAAAPLLR